MNRRLDYRFRMPEQACGIFAHEIHVAVAIKVNNLSAFPTTEGQREWILVQHAAGIASGQRAFSLPVGRFTQRVGGNITHTRVFNGPD